MLTSARCIAPLIALLTLFLLSGCAAGDRIMDRAGRAAERAVSRQVDNRTARAVDGAFNVGDNAVRCAFNDESCIRRASDRGEDVVLVDGDGNYVDRNGRRVENGDQDAVIRNGGPRPGVSNTNFDFTPGARTLFEDDFESTRTGNVPGSIRFVMGEVEVVEDGGNKVLQAARSSIFAVPMGERPDLFTLEFDLFLGEEGYLCITTTPIDQYSRLDQMDSCSQAEAWTNMTSLNITGFHGSHLVKTGFTSPSEIGGGTGEFGDYPDLNERYVPVRATVDGTYLKVYLDETRVVNIPNVALAPGSELFFFVSAEKLRSDEREGNAYFDNIRVGAGGQETGYATLSTGDRITARGILFDSGSAQLAGSSEAELNQLLSALESNSRLSIRIEGHTDSSGSADGNRRLSGRRAQAVVDWLVGRGISASRLESVGLGESQPVASNDTASGREQNRRVEIVGL